MSQKQDLSTNVTKRLYKDWVKEVQMMNKKLLVHWEWQQLVAGLWKSALDIHAIDKKHLLKGPVKNQSKIQLTSSQKEKEKESASVSEPVNQSSIMSFITKEETMKTEICWVLESLLSNCSFVSCSIKTELFTVCLVTVPLPSNFQWEKPNVAVTWRMEWLRTLKIFLAES